MPPKVKYSKNDVLRAATEITRRRGIDQVNARAIAKELGCSTQPLFREFQSMEEIRHEMVRVAMDAYKGYIARSASLSPMPYKGTGMAYILFAREEPEMFKLLFMRDRVRDGTMDESGDETLDYVLDILMRRTGWSRERAWDFHMRSWIFAHGLATMIATKYLDIGEEEISRLLTDEFEAMKNLYETKKEPRAD